MAYDAWLHPKGWADAAAKSLEAKGATLVAVESNPIDSVWQDRPAPSLDVAVVHGEQYSGKPSAEKRAAVAEWLKEQQLDAAVIAALDSVAWLLNIRGSDVERTPVTLSYVIAHADGTADLFINPEKMTPEVAAHLGNAVRVRDEADFVPALGTMAGQESRGRSGHLCGRHLRRSDGRRRADRRGAGSVHPAQGD